MGHRIQAKAAPSAPRLVPATAGALPPWLRHALRTTLHLTLDAAAVALAYYAAYLLRFGLDAVIVRFPIVGNVPSWELYHKLLYAIVPLWLGIFWYSCRLYSDPWMGAADRFLQIVKGSIMGAGAALLAAYVYSRLEYSRMMLVLAMPLGCAFLCVSQAFVLAVDSFLSTLEAALPVVIVGTGAVADEIKQRISVRHPGAFIREFAELPAPHELERAFSERRYFEMILLRSSLGHERILAAAEVCDAAGVGFKMVPDLLEIRLGEVQMDRSLGLPAYRIQHTSMTRTNFLAKRIFDLAFAGLVLAVTGIPFLIVAALIKLDSDGPVLYKQKRYGLRGKVFEAFKFRTMVANAESKISAVQGLNDQKGAFFKAKSDPRVTRVGKWLRRFSLDEFPQFLNVIRGEMSVVGPRPLALTTGELEALEKEFGATAKKRMNILPGITGLWQVSGRSDVSSEQRFSLDLFYIEHWSLGLDLEIILKTVPAMVSARGAY